MIQTKEMKEPETAKQMEDLLDYLNLNANELSIELGLSSNVSVYHLLKGKHRISPRFAKKIIDRYPGISYNWLMTAVGSIEEQEVDTNKKEESKPIEQKYYEVCGKLDEARRENESLKETFKDALSKQAESIIKALK